MIPECNVIDEIESYFKMLSKKEEVYIFGAGVYGRIFGQFFNEKHIEWKGYIDNNSGIWGKDILGHKVIKLTDLKKNKKKIVVVISKIVSVDERECTKIYEQLVQEGGLCDKQILQIYKKPCIFSEITYFVRKPKKALEKLKELKGIYKNQRAFLLGNGPSLQLCDLQKLRNELVFGCNGIYKLYENTDIQLTGFYFQDSQFFERFMREIDEIRKLNSISKYLFTTIVNEYTKNYYENNFGLYFVYHKYKNGEGYISEDIREGVCCWGTSVLVLLQIMLFMGINEIYLLGMDFSFHRELNDKGDIVINQNIKTHPDEIDGGELGAYGLYDKKLIENGWIFARNYADSHGIKIYNATRGGKLEVFERVNFDELF